MKKVFVGISGGVDSSVAAYLLKKQGYDVTGVFIKVWHPDFLPCNWRTEMRDAMRICAKLEIPFLFCDLSEEYKKGVIDYMIKEYSIGRTPNPDVMCNKVIKFNHFLKFALEKGADFIATGHYAQKKEVEGEFGLFESKDSEKDQTYFIWNLDQQILNKSLFPIGDIEKEEVRKIAKKASLNTAAKKDSQGLCFIGHVDIKDFLKKFIKTKKGDVLNEEEEVVGSHEGAELYTIGERHNFEIFQKDDKEKKYYIVAKDLEKNTLTVSNSKINRDTKIIKINNYNLIRNQSLKTGQEVEARIRYRQPLQKATIKNLDRETITLEFHNKQEAVTPGQSLVIHNQSECLGGGIII